MHVGGILIFEGPPPSYDDLLDHVQGRLHLVPRFRQKLAYPPAQTGRPFWVDDSSFNLEYHVRHSALPAPGSEEQLRSMAARVFSQQLDRTKPLWELWLVQGLTRKRFALITKTHHALVDGVSGVDIATVCSTPSRFRSRAEPDDGWVPARSRRARPWPPRDSRACADAGARRAPPGARDRSTRRRRRAGRRGARGSRRDRLGVRQPGAEGAAERRDRLAPALRVGAQRPGPASRGSRTRSAAPSTTSCSRSSRGRFASWLAAAASRPRGSSCGPRSRSRSAPTDERGQLGNRLAVMRAPLPVYIEDPVAPAPDRDPGDAGTEAVQAGARGRGDLALQRLRAAHPARPGGPDQLLHPPLQPGGDQRARAPGAALRAGARARGHLPGRLPAARTRRCSWRS